MTEVDLLVELMDEAVLDKALKASNAPVHSSASIMLKKTRLKEVFRNRSGRVSKRDRFFEYVKSIEISNLENVSDEYYLASVSSASAPEYVKLAYTWRSRNAIARTILPELIEKHKEGKKKLFDYIFSFPTEEAAIENVISLYKLDDSKSIQEHYGSIIEKKMEEKQRRQFRKLVAELKNVPFKEFIEKRTNYYAKTNEDLLNFAYCKAHPNLDFRLVYNYFLQMALDVNGNEQSVKLKELEEDLDRLKKAIEEDGHLELELDQQKKLREKVEEQHTVIKKDLHVALAERDKLRQDLDKIKQDYEKMREQLKKSEKEKNQLMAKHYAEVEDLQQKIETATTGVKETLHRIDSWAGDPDPCMAFGIIHSNQTDLLLELYPEIASCHIDHWNDNITELSALPTVYLQRDNCSTVQLQQIEKKFLGLNVSVRIFVAANDKELISVIEAIKVKEGETHVLI